MYRRDEQSLYDKTILVSYWHDCARQKQAPKKVFYTSLTPSLLVMLAGASLSACGVREDEGLTITGQDGQTIHAQNAQQNCVNPEQILDEGLDEEGGKCRADIDPEQALALSEAAVLETVYASQAASYQFTTWTAFALVGAAGGVALIGGGLEGGLGGGTGGQSIIDQSGLRLEDAGTDARFGVESSLYMTIVEDDYTNNDGTATPTDITIMATDKEGNKIEEASFTIEENDYVELRGDRFFIKPDIDIDHETFTKTIPDKNNVRGFKVEVTVKVIITAPDIDEEDIKDISIEIIDVNEEAPMNVAIESTNRQVDENTTFAAEIEIAKATAMTDVENDDIEWALAGADAGLFDIDKDGKISFKADTVFDYEAKSQYNITVTASVDGRTVSEKFTSAAESFSITVTDLNEDPTGMTVNTITSTVAENIDTTSRVQLATITFTGDPDDPTKTTFHDNRATIQSGNTGNRFVIENNILYLATGLSFDHEAGSNSHTITIAGTGGHSETFTLTVTDVNDEDPVFTHVDPDPIDEHSRDDENSWERQVVYTAMATPDVTGDTSLRYSLEQTGDHADFTINDITGVVTLTDEPDFETKPSYTFTVTATVGNQVASQVVTLNIDDVDERPTDIRLENEDENGNATRGIPDNTDTADGEFLIHITLTDDALPEDNRGDITLSDTTNFEVHNTDNRLVKRLYLKSGVDLVPLSVTLKINDGLSDEVARTFTLTISDDNDDDPTNISVSPSGLLIDETSETEKMFLATITITDDSHGDNLIQLTNNTLFLVEPVVGNRLERNLYLREGVRLDHDTLADPVIPVIITTGPVSDTFTLTVTDINDTRPGLTYRDSKAQQDGQTVARQDGVPVGSGEVLITATVIPDVDDTYTIFRDDLLPTVDQGATIEWDLEGTHKDLFSIKADMNDPTKAYISFAADTTPDFEALSVYNFRISVTVRHGGNGQTHGRYINLNITDRADSISKGGSFVTREDAPIEDLRGSLAPDVTNPDVYVLTFGEMEITRDGVTVNGTYGQFTVNKDGSWTYHLDNSLAEDLSGDDSEYTENIAIKYDRPDDSGTSHINEEDSITDELMITIQGQTDIYSSVTSPTNNVLDYSASSDRLTLHNDANIDNLTMIGGAGTDILKGGTANDILEGKAGEDILEGGAGADTAIFDYSAETTGLRLEVTHMTGWRLKQDQTWMHTATITPTLMAMFMYYGRVWADIDRDETHSDGDEYDYFKDIEHFTLIGGTDDDTIIGGEGTDDTIIGGAGADDIDGRGGTDIISYDSMTNATTARSFMLNPTTGRITDSAPSTTTTINGVHVDLTTRAQSATNNGDASGDELTNIENITGTDFADYLVGSDFNNVLRGGAGNDWLIGLGGADEIYGEEGDDTLYGGMGGDQLYGGAGRDRLYGGVGGDTLYGNEGNDTLYGGADDDTIYGGADDDTIYGEAGDDILHGDAGNDVIEGGAGADTIDGGVGDDTASYANMETGVSDRDITVDGVTAADRSGVYIDLRIETQSSVNNIDASGDRLRFIEHVRGSRFKDLIIGDAEQNTLNGGDEDDIMRGGDEEDMLYGEEGSDELYGDAGDDTLTGGAGDDHLYGGAGNDVLNGGDDNDILEGGAGRDRLDGGNGDDTASYANMSIAVISRNISDNAYIADGRTGVYVNLNKTQQDTNNGDASDDLLLNLKSLRGSAFGDYLVGRGDRNILEGLAGDDILQGEAGDDTLRGGDDNDTLIGGVGADTLVGGDNTSGQGDLVSYKLTATALTGRAITEMIDGNSVTLASGVTGVYVYLGKMVQDTGNGEASGDRLSGIESIEGTDYKDVLVGDDEDNHLLGRAGDDVFYGGAGADTLKGGADSGSGQRDFVSYKLTATALTGRVITEVINGINVILASGVTGVYVHLGKTTQDTNNGDASGDSLSGIESIEGTAHNDVLVGDGEVNYLFGGGGDDVLAGGAGADMLMGGAGANTASYGTMSVAGPTRIGADFRDPTFGIGSSFVNINGVYVHLSKTTQDTNNGDASGDVFSNIEHVTGSQFNDLLIGDEDDNILTGGAGADDLVGGLGHDTLIGGAGNDFLRGNDGNDILTGNAGDDILGGWAGEDTLDGGAGDDLLSGGAGDDILKGGTGDEDKVLIRYTVNMADLTIFVLETAGWTTSDGGVSWSFSATDAANGVGYGRIWTDLDGDGVGGSDPTTPDADDEYDYILGVEQFEFRTSFGDDHLRGGVHADVFFGGSGRHHHVNPDSDTVYFDYLTDARTDEAPYTWGGEDHNYTGIYADLTRGETNEGDSFVSHSIENLVGSRFDDLLIGWMVANVLKGGAGDDVIYGENGDDHLYGDTDILTNTRPVFLMARPIAPPISARAADPIAYEADLRVYEADLRVYEAAIMEYNRDVGDDTIYGGSGNDTIYGDTDTLTNTRPVLSLIRPTAPDESAGTAARMAYEVALGEYEAGLTEYSNDLRQYNDAVKTYWEFFSGGDIIDGGAGVDTVSYEHQLHPSPSLNEHSYMIDDRTQIIRIQGVFVDLRVGLQADNNGHASLDNLSNIENVIGSPFSDLIIGNDNDNILIGWKKGSNNNAGIAENEAREFGQSIYGEGGNDTIYLGDRDGTVVVDANGTAFGGAGNDRIYGSSGIDSIWGGTGNDILRADWGGLLATQGQGNDILNGGLGNDELYGNDVSNRLIGGKGSDVIEGRGGSDFIYNEFSRAATIDVVDGGDGNDFLSFGYSNVAEAFDLDGDDFSQRYRKISNTNFVADANGAYRGFSFDGTEQHYFIHVELIAFSLGSGDDKIAYFSGLEAIDDSNGGGTETVTIDYTTQTEAVTVDVAQDEASRWWFASKIVGQDYAWQSDGNSSSYLNRFQRTKIKLGSGDEFYLYWKAIEDWVLIGGTVNDVLKGADGVDILRGNAGDDTLEGEGGNDKIFGGLGADTIRGGDGNDEIYGDSGDSNDDNTSYNGGTGDVIHGGAGDDSIYGQGGADEIYGGDGADTIYAGDGDDKIDGGDGDDTIIAGAGNDIITVNAGTEIIDGGTGDDWAFIDYSAYNTTNMLLEMTQTTGWNGSRTNAQTSPDGAWGRIWADLDGLVGNPGTRLYDKDDDDYKYTYRVEHIGFKTGSGDDRIVVNPRSPVHLIDGGRGTDDENTYEFNYLSRNTNMIVEPIYHTPYIGQLVRQWKLLDDGRFERYQGSDTNTEQFSQGYIYGLVYFNLDNDTDNFVSHDSKRFLNPNDIDPGDDFVFMSSAFTHLVFRGGSRVDTFTGRASSELYDGGAGDDALAGAGGDDILNGGEGEDTLDGGDGDDTLNGNNDDDAIHGGAGNDTIDGGAGIDTLNGNAGDDIIRGGTGNDIINGGAGNDIIEGGAGADNITGGVGEDTASYANSPQHNIPGQTFKNGANVRINVDGVIINMQSKSYRGGHAVGDKLEHIENLIGSAFNDVLVGRDVDSANGTANTLWGGAGDDKLIGRKGADTLYGGDGSDELNGEGHDDVLDGGAGRDVLNGGNGNDILDGGDGVDVLNGGNGNDILDGGAGRDVLHGENGNDTASYESMANPTTNRTFNADPYNTGFNSYNAAKAAAFGGFPSITGVVIDLNIDDELQDLANNGDAQNDKLISIEDVIGSNYNDHLITWAGIRGHHDLWGGGGDDVLQGGHGNNSLYGGDGDDILLARGGNDILDGGAGDDVLVGRDTAQSYTDKEVMTGGAGADKFFIGDGGVSNNVATTTATRITDFTQGEDQLAFLFADSNIFGNNIQFGYRDIGADTHIHIQGVPSLTYAILENFTGALTASDFATYASNDGSYSPTISVIDLL